MKFERKRGVSVLVATLLLVAISVSAAIIVYVFIGGLSGNLLQNGGQPVTEKLTIQSYNFQISPGSCGCAQKILEIYVYNAGPASTTINAVYYNGQLLNLGTNPVANTPLVNDEFYLVTSTAYLESTTPGDFFLSAATNPNPVTVTSYAQIIITFTTAATYGTGATVKVVSSTGAQNVYTVEAGISG